MPAASVDVTSVRDRFNFDWATNPDNGAPEDTYWWWARSVRADPNEVIADDGEGNLWSVTFSYDEPTDTITFSAPVRVREAFVPVQSGDGAAASALVSRRRQVVLAAALEKPSKPAPKTTTAASRPLPDQEVAPMAIDVAALRSRLQLSEDTLPDDATEEQINAALSAEQDTTPPPETETPEAETPAPEAEREPEPVAASVPDTVTVSRQVWEQTNKRLTDVEASERTRTEAETKTRRDTLASEWVQQGRITPAEHQHYRGMLDVDETKTVALASTLAAGRVPVDERGSSASAEDSTTSGDGTGWFAHKFPKEA